MTDELKPASPLPWVYCGCKDHQHLGAGSRKAGTWLACVGLRDANGHRVDDSDPYIVVACNAYPDLHARVAALEAENARLREALERREVANTTLEETP